MKKHFNKILPFVLISLILLGSVGCNLTTTKVTSTTKTSIRYEDEEGKPSEDTQATNGTESEDKRNSETSNNTKTKNLGTTTTSGIQSNTPTNAGKVDNTTEEKLTGSLELQIFAGGYGSECWEYAISEFEKL